MKNLRLIFKKKTGKKNNFYKLKKLEEK